ncbi:protein kinase domain-containing protein [Nannocystis pusilla]|uniref:serine/threonine-protein kinase n=1 Tax=Nannocystis pusilla TaxID=889268 RepID=UPI003B78E589
MESKEPTRPTLAASVSFDRTLAGPAQPTRPPSLVDTRAETFAGDRRSGAADRQIQHGQLIGRYMVLSPLGSGGMGVVYAAYDPQLDRKVALKLLHPEAVSASGATQSKIDGQERLLREAQAMARLHHPNVVAVHDVGKYDERIFIAMEFVEGGTLKQWLRARPRTRQEVLAVFSQAGRGLQAAHEAGLVHRDFKPDNVLVSDKGRAQVLDFGLAKQTEDGESRSPSDPPPAPQCPSTPRSPRSARSSDPGVHVPEQHLGEATDARTDQFSFCVALYEALYGTPPFHGDSMAALATAVLTGEVAEAPRESYARVPRGCARSCCAAWPSTRPSATPRSPPCSTTSRATPARSASAGCWPSAPPRQWPSARPGGPSSGPRRTRCARRPATSCRACGTRRASSRSRPRSRPPATRPSPLKLGAASRPRSTSTPRPGRRPRSSPAGPRRAAPASTSSAACAAPAWPAASTSCAPWSTCWPAPTARWSSARSTWSPASATCRPATTSSS